MNRHYDRYLTTKYAPLYRDRNAPMNETAMCWGFCCGDGWFNIINALSLELCSSWLQAKQDYDAIKDHEGKLIYEAVYDDTTFGESTYNYRITKEKIAEAEERMKEEEAKIPVVMQVKEKFGTLRFYVTGATDEQYAVISLAETMSSFTCEVCGERGKQTNKNGYIQTLCKEHCK